jgi:hypothetical protein
VYSLLAVSGQHIGKVIINVEKKQPLNEIGGIHTVIQALKNKVEVELYYPKSFYNLGPLDYSKVKQNQDYRWTLPYQYALENTDKPFLLIMHNDMLFSDNDIVGDMLDIMQKSDNSITGVGSIGQCWSCPASMNFSKNCHSDIFLNYRPTKTEALKLHQKYNTPRKERDMYIINDNRVFPLPECRLNEYACLINTAIYKKNTLPLGKAQCFGGRWDGADLGTSWFYDMVTEGFRFENIVLAKYAEHSPFNPVGQGVVAYSNIENYQLSESNAKQYLIKNQLFTEDNVFTKIKILKDILLNNVKKVIMKVWSRFNR